MLRKAAIFASLPLIASCAAQPEYKQLTSERVDHYQVETDKPYDEVLAELEIAIAEHNFRITGHSRVGKVIRDRGAKAFPEYDTVQFCNLTLAKTMLEITPHAIGYMPCNVVTYQFSGKTRIKTHLLPEHSDNPAFNRFAAQMNSQLKQIVDFAAEQ
ncbi:MAG: DUF302 domain-containing protein [Methylomonas sp.]|jgi:uncharacterized protein (DUF302 family)|uniref:DUF302 domain-containing protein n=1 Tax=Methylomonas sp. TaxID=418 RepID=UPI0025E6FC08|nr:DUF302 domain-containing protein [Methylomonas sp.]MCK9607428.1 DUF302 domain-containing protein [Methylomonas sp.]